MVGDQRPHPHQSAAGYNSTAILGKTGIDAAAILRLARCAVRQAAIRKGPPIGEP